MTLAWPRLGGLLFAPRALLAALLAALLVSAALGLLALEATRAPAPGQPEQLAVPQTARLSPGGDPLLLSAASARLGRALPQFWLRRHGGLLAARSPGLATEFTRPGPRFAVGRSTFALRLSRARLGPRAAGKNAVRYHAPGILESWTNGPFGVSQRLQVGARGRAPKLRIAFALSGARATARGLGEALLRDAQGRTLARYAGLRAWDAHGRVLAARMRVSARSLTLEVSARGAYYPVTIDPLIQRYPRFSPEDVEKGAAFGFSVALSADGQTALVGAPAVGAAGAAWVFVKSATGWVAQGSRLAPQGLSEGAFFGGTLALSGDGNTAVIGSSSDGSFGSAWVYQRTSGQWSAPVKLAPSDPDPGGPSLFGTSVTISSDGRTLLIGGWGDAYGYGAAWVFTRSGSSWTQQGAKLKPASEVSDSKGLSWFGGSVALSADGNTALIGGRNDRGEAGGAWVFTRSGSSWGAQGGELTGTGPSQPSQFGAAVALSADGSTALIGGPIDNAERGAAWAFTRSGSSWSQQGGKLTASDTDASANLGRAVALSPSGDLAYAGAFFDADGIGALASFTRTGGSWSAAPKLTPVDGDGFDEFGSAVAVAGEGQSVLVGGENTQWGNGAAFAFQQAPAALTPTVLGADGADQDYTQPIALSAWSKRATAWDETWGGLTTFRVYGPDAENCSGPAAASASAEMYPEGTGVDLNIKAPGFYWGIVSYSGDATHGPWTSACGDFSFSGKARPKVSVSVSGPQSVGSALAVGVTVQTEFAAQGTVELRIYAEDDTTCDGPTLLDQVLEVHGGLAAPVSYTPALTGHLHIEASYAGDDRNLVESGVIGCVDGPELVIDRAQPTLTLTRPGPASAGSSAELTAQLQGGAAPAGVVRFNFYRPDDPSCAAVASSAVVVPLRDGAASSGPVALPSVGTYQVTAEYPGDSLNRPARSACGETPLAVAKRTTNLALSGTVSRSGSFSTIDVSAKLDAQATGTVAFTLFGPGDPSCARKPAASIYAPVSGGTARSGALGPAKPGRYELVASYSGDAKLEAVNAGCHSASVRVPAPPAGRLTLRSVRVRGPSVRLALGCLGPEEARCTGWARLSVGAGARSPKTLVKRTLALRAGQTLTAQLAPSRRQLAGLGRSGRGSVLLTLGRGSAVLAKRRLHLRTR